MPHPKGAIWTERLLLLMILASLAGTANLVRIMHRRAQTARPNHLVQNAPATAPAPKSGPVPPVLSKIAQAPPIVRSPAPAPPPVKMEDPTPKIVAGLRHSVELEKAAARRADERASALGSAREAASAESERWRRREALVRGQIASLSHQAERLERDAVELDAERDVLARERDALKAALSRAGQHASYAVLPYKGPNGTWRRPIVVECVGNVAVLQPAGHTFSMADLSPLIHPRSSPFILEIAREMLRVRGSETPDGAPAVPYLVFLVRPSGIRPYYEARARLAPLGIAFGYELIDQDLAVNVPNYDDVSTWDGTIPLDVPSSAPSRSPDGWASNAANADRAGGPAPAPARNRRGGPLAWAGDARQALGGAGGDESGESSPEDFVWPSAATAANGRNSRPGTNTNTNTNAHNNAGASADQWGGGPDADGGTMRGRGRLGGSGDGTGGRGGWRDRAETGAGGARNEGDRGAGGGLGDRAGGGLSDENGRSGGARSGTAPILRRKNGTGPLSGPFGDRASGDEDGRSGGARGSSSPFGPNDRAAGPGPGRGNGGTLAASAEGGRGAGTGQPGPGAPGANSRPSSGTSAPGAPASGTGGSGPLPDLEPTPGGGLASGGDGTSGDGMGMGGTAPASASASAPASSPLVSTGDRGATGISMGPRRPGTAGSSPSDAPPPDAPPPDLATLPFDSGPPDAPPLPLPPGDSPGTGPASAPAPLTGLNALSGRASAAGRPGTFGGPNGPTSDFNSLMGNGAAAGALGGAGGIASSTDADASGLASGSGFSGASSSSSGAGASGASGSTSPLGSPSSGPGLSLPSLGQAPDADSLPDSMKGFALPEIASRDRPPGSIEVPFEIVVVCRRDDLILQPGGHRISTRALREGGGKSVGEDGLLKRELSAMVRRRAQVDPLIRPRPSVKFLVEDAGGTTFWVARRQLMFSGLNWPMSLRVAGAQDGHVFNEDAWDDVWR